MNKKIIHNGHTYHIQTSGRYYSDGNKGAVERLLHRRIWFDAHGEIPKSMQVHHINGDWTDNRLENLEIVDRHEHQVEHGRKSMENPERRARLLDAQKVAITIAPAWHASDDGRKWHRENAKKQWENPAKHKCTCRVCGVEFESFHRCAQLCSGKCGQKGAFQRQKTKRSACIECGVEFMQNKYRSQECCSHKCANVRRGRSMVGHPRLRKLGDA